jgi:heme-degrading monooxygenase HmoA
MSVFMILRVKGDADGFEQYAKSNAALVSRIGAAGKAAGATRHSFAAGDGELLVIDEWPDADAFQQFFASQTEIPQLMKDGGALGAPEISFYRKLDTPDAF